MKLPLLVAIVSAGVALAANAADWRSRSIYQVLTDRFGRPDGSTTAPCNTDNRQYCGGTYNGLIKQLDYIQGMGFTAIWISPVTRQIEDTTGWGDAYHGYWQQDLYHLNSHFGSPEDLRHLSDELHRRGMYLMLDVVVNHNSWNGPASSVKYAAFHPFDNEKYYHPYCQIVDWSNQTEVESCWMGDNIVSLADLDTQRADVKQGYQSWISGLVANYSVDGLRLDTAREVQKDFFPEFASAAGVFITGEIEESNAKDACSYQQYLNSLLNYPIYYPLLNAFKSTSGNISDLVNEINQVKSACSDSTVLGTFSENHDNPRFASYTADMSLAKNIIAFTILADGIPVIYAGQEQHYSGGMDPKNREALWLSGYNMFAPLYVHISLLNQLRNHVARMHASSLSHTSTIIYNDSTTLVLHRGVDDNPVITVLSNLGSGGSKYTLSLKKTGYHHGQEIIEVLTCTPITVSENGDLPVQMDQGLPRVFYPISQLRASGICSL